MCQKFESVAEINRSVDNRKQDIFFWALPCLYFFSMHVQVYILSQQLNFFVDMARGHQKIQSQQKNAEKKAAMKKTLSHDQKKAAQKALVHTCTVCKVCNKLCCFLLNRYCTFMGLLGSRFGVTEPAPFEP